MPIFHRPFSDGITQTGRTPSGMGSGPLIQGLRTCASACTAKKYLRVEPNGSEESSESAGMLCLCAPLCRNDPSVSAAERESLVRSYSDQAVDALRFAVGRGSRDLNALKSTPTYEPLRKRDDFQDIVRELEAKSEAARLTR